MSRKSWNLLIAIFLLSGSIAHAEQINFKNKFKDNPDGSQTLLNHVPKHVVRGLSKKIAHADSNKTLDLRIMLPIKDSAGLNNFIKNLYNPKSPIYHKFITPQQFAQQFGPSAVDTALVIEHLKSLGLTVKSQSKNGLFLTVTGKASNVEHAFKLNINNYKKTDGTLFFAPDADPTIPTPIAGKVNALIGLDNAVKFKPCFHRYIAPKKTNVTQSGLKAATYHYHGPNGGLEPQDVAVAYNFPLTTNNGHNETLALFEFDGYTTIDISTYASTLGFPMPNLQVIPVDNPIGYPTGGDGTYEVTADIEIALGIAQGLSKIIVYEAPDDGWLDMWQAIADGPANVVSASWALTESDLGDVGVQAENAIFSTMVAKGMTIFAASGDWGSYTGLDALAPASDPYVTAVGISTLSTKPQDGTWNGETGASISGGGYSGSWTIPTWQTFPPGSTPASETQRNIPDVCLTASYLGGQPSTYYDFFIEGSWVSLGGSSISSPIWAGFMAYVDQGRSAPIGFLNPVLYLIAATPSNYSKDFHDITTGNNGFPASTGYDAVTGLGSFNGVNLYADIVGLSAPAAPTGLTATISSGAVTLNWNASSGATSYQVKVSSVSGGPYTNVSGGTTSNTTFTQSSLANGYTYYYVVSANNIIGSSGNSNEAKAVLFPATPTNLTASGGMTQAGLSWTASLGAVSYNVKRSTVSGSGYSIVTGGAAVAATSFIDSGLTNGTTYYYVVSGVNTSGEGSNSTPASVTVLNQLPTTPSYLGATPGNSQVTLNWAASTAAVYYHVKRSTQNNGPYATLTTSQPVTTTTYIDTTVTNGTNYYYVVTGVNPGGESNPSPQANVSPGLPGAPVSLIATAGNQTVNLTWSAPTTGGTPDEGYSVYRSNSSGSGYTFIGDGGGTSFPDTNLTNGKTYYYVVAATNEVGTGPYSNEAHATPQIPAPQAPATLTATPGNTQVSLTWAASSTAASYNIYRATTSAGEVLTHTDITTSAYTDIGLTNGQTYYYKVTAVNAGGESPKSPEASATPQVALPLAPTNVTATQGNGQVTLNWTAGTGAVSYDVYRSTISGSYSAPNYTGITTMPYIDTGVTNRTEYFYVITSVNGAGQSANSAEVNATPQMPAPTGLIAAGGNAQVLLSWTASPQAASYNIYRSTTSGSYSSPTQTGITTVSYMDRGLTNYQTYYYVVTAVGAGSAGESANSNQVSAMPTPAPINGVCGTASMTYAYGSTSFGSNTLCAAGNPNPARVAFPGVGQTVSWTCQGINGGANVSCSAKQNPKVIFRM